MQSRVSGTGAASLHSSAEEREWQQMGVFENVYPVLAVRQAAAMFCALSELRPVSLAERLSWSKTLSLAVSWGFRRRVGTR